MIIKNKIQKYLYNRGYWLVLAVSIFTANESISQRQLRQWYGSNDRYDHKDEFIDKLKRLKEDGQNPLHEKASLQTKGALKHVLRNLENNNITTNDIQLFTTAYNELVEIIERNSTKLAFGSKSKPELEAEVDDLRQSKIKPAEFEKRSISEISYEEAMKRYKEKNSKLPF